MSPARFLLCSLLAAGWAASPPAPAAVGAGAEVRVDGARLNRRLAALAEIGRTAEGGVERLAFGPDDLKARRHVRDLMRGAGLEVRVDAAGNIIGRKPGSAARLPSLLLGSHIDTVPAGGRFDGALGVLAAIECLETIRERRLSLDHPVEVVVFADEEGGSIGSRAMSGALRPADLEARSQSGPTIREGIRALGGDPERLRDAARAGEPILAYLELHIEQGGRLEKAGSNIGLVEGIVGIRRWDVTVIGEANHAGTTPMGARRDALQAAARFILAVPEIVRSEPGDQVGNVGRIKAEPGAPNVVPGRVEMTLELRDLSEAKIEALFAKARAKAEAVGAETGTRFSFAATDPGSAPALADERVRACLAAAAASRGCSVLSLPSGAGHDAQNMARLAPMGMIFIPSRGGLSHTPREYSSPEDIARGADVLLAALLDIDRGCLGRTAKGGAGCP